MENNQKMYSIGEIKELIGVPSHTLRYWEKEFSDTLRPARTQGKQRRYGETDLKTLTTIYKLLKKEKYSIAGAKQKLKGAPSEVPLAPAGFAEEFAEKVTELIKEKLY